MVGEDILTRLRDQNPRYAETAFLFLDRLDEPRHITGRELAEGCRDLAIGQFGPMARTVLQHWGIHSTTDMGEIVYALIDCNVLIKQDSDSREDFQNVFDFEEAFETNYPWGKPQPRR